MRVQDGSLFIFLFSFADARNLFGKRQFISHLWIFVVPSFWEEFPASLMTSFSAAGETSRDARCSEILWTSKEEALWKSWINLTCWKVWWCTWDWVFCETRTFPGPVHFGSERSEYLCVQYRDVNSIGLWVMKATSFFPSCFRKCQA